MSKRKRRGNTIEDVESKRPKEPVFTHAAYRITFWTVVVGLIAQVVMAIIVYPSLPEFVPSGWLGSSVPYNMIPSWLVFVAFPSAQVVILLLTVFTPKDAQERRVMESGKAWSLVLLALLFTALQASAFHIPNMG